MIIAEGSRTSADQPWDVDFRSPQKNLGGRADYDEKIASLLAKGYALVGDELQIVKAPPPKSPEQVELEKRKAEYVALLRASGGAVTWKDPGGAFFEIRVEGSRVHIRRGKDGEPDETEQSNRGLEELACEYAATKLHEAAGSGFGPS